VRDRPAVTPGREVYAVQRDRLAYLFGGLAFGILLGYGLFHSLSHVPGSASAAPQSDIPSPAGPVQMGGGAPDTGAPMMEEIRNLRRLLEAEPRNLQVLSRLAHIHHDAGMWDQAISYYQRALEIAPTDPNLLTDMGICYQGLQQFEKALELFSEAQRADPSHWQSLYNTVVVAGFDLGRFDEADAALRRLEQVHPAAPNLPQLRQNLEHVREHRTGAGTP
jgi:tetratricopeptide (TPR) repeat protein